MCGNLTGPAILVALAFRPSRATVAVSLWGCGSRCRASGLVQRSLCPAISPLHDRRLFSGIQAWNVRTRDGRCVPLVWNVVRRCRESHFQYSLNPAWCHRTTVSVTRANIRFYLGIAGRQVDCHCTLQISFIRSGGFKKTSQFRCGSELRDGIKFLECRGKRIGETLDRSRPEFLVLRLEVQVMHAPGKVLRRFEFALDECLVDDHLSSDVRQLTSLPRFHLLSHRLKVALHAINTNRNAVDERERL